MSKSLIRITVLYQPDWPKGEGASSAKILHRKFSTGDSGEMLPSLFFSLPLDRQSPLIDLYQKFAEYDSHMANMSSSENLANALQERLRIAHSFLPNRRDTTRTRVGARDQQRQITDLEFNKAWTNVEKWIQTNGHQVVEFTQRHLYCFSGKWHNCETSVLSDLYHVAASSLPEFFAIVETYGFFTSVIR
jgi:hypothetical protein